jgi:hypothetical protein
MKKILFIAGIAAIFAGCNNQPVHHHLSKDQLVMRQDSLRGDLLRTDIAFSQLSEAKGRNAAFLEYADSDAVMLRKFSQPITGKDQIVALLNNHPDSSYTLTWIPISADVALSGDLGYTYGTYSFTVKGEGTTGGTYCTIWKRSKAHNWKFALGSGNQGLKDEDRSQF